MRLSDFDYDLPEHLIAQEPAPCRDESRLLALVGAQTRHLSFREILQLLAPGDLLVINDTRVLPARLFGTLASGGRAEVLLLEEVGPRSWSAMVRPGRKLKCGAAIGFGDVSAVVEEVLPGGERLLKFTDDPLRLMALAGELPLPPYIRGRPADPERYQTIYAARPGAVAAPTAGLHFTPELVNALRAQGVDVAALTLHVGPGTFRPVKVENLDEHRMHRERFEIPESTAEAVTAARERGGRVVAVGTTVVRSLEAAAGPDGRVRAMTGTTDLFIRPGYRFKAVDALITNFHLPRSTLLMLVAAFAEHAGLGGLARIREAYATAVEEGYRFFSFGDAMILLPR